jgi:hypothetical protein
MAGAGVFAWRAFVSIDRTDPRRKFTALGFGIASVVVVAAALVVVATTVNSASAPAGALLDFVNGG